MANTNDISQHYKIDKGLDLTSDSQFATLNDNEVIVYKPDGEKYIKNPNYSNVFDKTNSISDIEEKVNTQVVSKITDADVNGVASYYNIENTKLGEFKCGLPVLGSEGNTNVTAISQNGNILTVEVPRVYYDKYGRVTKWDKQTATAIIQGGQGEPSENLGYTGVPVGTISMWAGSVGDIPVGWHLCDGTDGTPDLRDKFVVGAGRNYNPGAHGGHSSYELSWVGGLNIDTIKSKAFEDNPAKNEFFGNHDDLEPFGYSKNGDIETWRFGMDTGTGVQMQISRDISKPQNRSFALQNIPPFYALCYIMKVQADGSPVKVTNNEPGLQWGQTSTIGTIDDKPLTVKMPDNPAIAYTAGDGILIDDNEISADVDSISSLLGGGEEYNFNGNGGWRLWKIGKLAMIHVPEKITTIMPQGNVDITIPVDVSKIISVQQTETTEVQSSLPTGIQKFTLKNSKTVNLSHNSTNNNNNSGEQYNNALDILYWIK